MSVTPRSFWTYQSSEPTPDVDALPSGAFDGAQKEFEKLTPGMRREILRTALKLRDRQENHAITKPSGVNLDRT